MIPTVVIGGERRIVDEDITPRLNRHGLDVIDVFPMDKEMGDLPKDARIFFFVTNMMSHRHNDYAKAEAERRGDVKVIYGTSKGSIITQRLIDAGYPEVRTVKPAKVPVESDSVIHISNPKLPGGFYQATVYDGDIDEEKMVMLYSIDYGPEGTKHAGKVYTDVLLRKEDYASGKPIDQLLDFLRSIGVELGKTNKGLADLKARQDRLYGRIVYFQLVPAGNSTRVVYLDASIWQIKSANQRRRHPITPIEPVTLVPPPVEEIMVTPTPAPQMNGHKSTPAPVHTALPNSPTFSATLPPATWVIPFRPGADRTEYDRLIRFIATNPLVTKEETAAYMGVSVYNATYDVYWRTARRTLGVVSMRTSPVTIDRTLYEPACAELGITPVGWSECARTRKINATPALAELPTPPSPAAHADAPPAAAAPAPVAFIAETPAPSDDLTELREILAMLRDEMVKRDIRRMVVTPSGVDFTRVVTVEAKMEF